MADLFESLNWVNGQINPSGIKSIIYFAPKSDIASFPKIKAAPASAAENVQSL